jgi:cytochrome c peroxidase
LDLAVRHAIGEEVSMRIQPPGLVLLATAALWGCAGETTLEPTSSAVHTSLSNDPGVVAVGRAIFFDQRLSINGNQSCADCHSAAWGWTGPQASINAAGAVYEG